ncbi:MAG: hypothetical protein KJ977_03105, partial [Candidatus Omnitrophica bacterium]|nr:hypothetical protein [Candidatus Omnitrophota bacterium]
RKVSKIKVEDLDYSNLLRDDEVEYKYSWFYVLKNSLETNDWVKLQALADSFEKVLGKLDIHDSFDLGELEFIVTKFFAYLRDKDKERYLKCLNSFAKLTLNLPEGSGALNIDRLKSIFRDLESGDLAGILFERLKDLKGLDGLNFGLFSQLLSRQDHEKVSLSLAEKLERAKWIKNNPRIVEKIKNIFSLSQDPGVSDVYRKNLSSILSGISLGEGFSFDRQQLKDNYRAMLLDLFNSESDLKRLNLIADKVLAEVKECVVSGKKDYPDRFIEVLQAKRSQGEAVESFFQDYDNQIGGFLEEAVFSKDISFDFSRFIEISRQTTRDPQYYFDKIFKQRLVNKYILQLFFKFFPEETDKFCHQIQLASRQLNLVKAIIESLKSLKSPQALKVFETVFVIVNDFIKLEILKAVGAFLEPAETFLFEVLKDKRILLRRQAFDCLVKYPQVRQKLAEELLLLKNPFGLNSRILRENLEFVSANFFEEARRYLNNLTGYRFFWNRQIRIKSANILKRYG